MKYTLQNQHYHLAALTGFFWGEIINEKIPRETKLSLIRINKFLDSLYNSIPNININDFCNIVPAKDIMFSKLIYKETEDKIQVNTIENDFYKLSKELSKKQDENNKFITSYRCDEEEYNIVMHFFYLQYVRNPNLYTNYLNQALIKNNIDYMKLLNIETINIIDRKIINSMNNIILEQFNNCQQIFKDYSFQIFENPNNNNLLIDHTVIQLNHNDYFKKLFGSDFNKIGILLEKTYIITINSKFILFFYPPEIESEIYILKELYLKHYLTIYLLNARYIISIPKNENVLKLEIENFVEKIGIKNIKYYIERNNFIEQIERKIKKTK